MVPGLTGKVMGGEQPIRNASVYLYTTTSVGYPNSGNTSTAGTQQASTTSDANGNWSLGAFTCPSNQEAYMFALAGDSGTGSNNAQIIQFAALGACNSLPSVVDMDEVTTVAGAYALGNFMYIDGIQPGAYQRAGQQ